MARIQALKQERFMESQNAPTTSFQMTGGSSNMGGVPKMHPLKSSNPILKSTNLFHTMKMKMPHMSGSSVHMPGMKMSHF